MDKEKQQEEIEWIRNEHNIMGWIIPFEASLLNFRSSTIARFIQISYELGVELNVHPMSILAILSDPKQCRCYATQDGCIIYVLELKDSDGVPGYTNYILIGMDEYKVDEAIKGPVSSVEPERVVSTH